MVIRLMKKDSNEASLDAKSQLAIEICKLYHNARLFVSCIHLQTSLNSLFIDWYLILRVGEDASSETIRKQFYNLALMLHPDKNKHPQAEFAFKLINKAYKCLSDDATRYSFNLERLKKQCRECNRTSENSHPPNPSKNTKRGVNSANSTSNHINQHLDIRLVRKQLIEEARVIQNCVRINQRSKNEYPVFDPSNYRHLGYPHTRSHFHHSKKRFKL